MTASQRAELERHYKELEQRWSMVDRTDYGRLVTPTGNATEPIHRWFHLKEAFSFQLLGRIAKDLGLGQLNDVRILDCFSGAGTTLVSTVLESLAWSGRAEAVGVEVNPFLYFLGSTKSAVAAAPNRKMLAASISAYSKTVAEIFLERRDEALQTVIPMQATLQNKKYFDAQAVQELLLIKEIAAMVVSGLARNVLVLLAVASLESCGRLRRDGRALRFDPRRQPADPLSEFLRRTTQASVDIAGLPDANGQAKLFKGDFRTSRGAIVAAREFDLAIFSPPYPNNIDYTEVYKTEAWMLGSFQNSEQFRQHRYKTLRSHPSITFPDKYKYTATSNSQAVESLIAPLLDAVPPGRWNKQRIRMLKGYVDDMLGVFSQCRAVSKPTSRIAFVVGNSRHGSGDESFDVAADLLLARAAELAGWEVNDISVARLLGRRGINSGILRESIVSLSRSS